MPRVAVALAVLFPELALGATLRVPQDFDDVVSAVASAESGDVIEIGSGTWSGVLTPGVDVVLRGVATDVVLNAPDAVEDSAIIVVNGTSLRLESLAIEAGGVRGIQASDAAIELVDVSLSGGSHSVSGGGIDVVGGSLSLTRASLEDNRSGEGLGGHISAVDATVELVAGSIEGGRAERGGGVYVSRGSLSVDGTRFERNAARRDEDRGVGGAIAAENVTVVIRDATFIDNRVTEGQGGAVSIFRGSATIEGTRFEGKPGSPSATEYYGGGLAVYDAPLSIEDCQFVDLSVEHSGDEDSFGFGAGLIIYGPTGADFSIVDSTFSGNAASAFGGGIRIDSGSGRIAGCTFTDNVADYGGALQSVSPGELLVEDSVFTGNSARFAGAIRWRPPSAAIETSALRLAGNRFEDNVSDNYGGVLYGRGGGRFEARDNAMHGNTGTLGGALMLWTVRDVEIVRNQFCANASTGGTAPDGGAVASYQSGRGTYTIANNLFVENRAGAYGGALSLLQDGDVDLRHNSFLGNAAPDGSAVGIRGTSTAPVVLRIHDSLFAYQAGGAAIGGGSVARLELEHSALFANEGDDVEPLLDGLEVDVLRVDPQLQAFVVDGDCASDIPYPAWGSPLIDAADPESIDLDGSRADIGASGGPLADPDLWVDADADLSPILFDCDDADEARSPIVPETPYDGIDQDCDGEDLVDVDGDGFDGGEGPDCDDEVAGINPDAPEVPDDGIDQDCDGEDLVTVDVDDDPEQDPAEAGCACTSAPSGPSWSLLVLLGLFGLGRRRLRAMRR